MTSNDLLMPNFLFALRQDRESEEECAQVNDVQDDAEWLDELARQFMMGPSATQSPTARDGSF